MLITCWEQTQRGRHYSRQTRHVFSKTWESGVDFVTGYTYTHSDTTKLGFYFISFFSFLPSSIVLAFSRVHVHSNFWVCGHLGNHRGALLALILFVRQKGYHGHIFPVFSVTCSSRWGAAACFRRPFRLKDTITTSSVLHTVVTKNNLIWRHRRRSLRT